MVPEDTQGGYAVGQCPPIPCHNFGWRDVWWGLGHVGLAPVDAGCAGYALQLGVLYKVPPPIDAADPDAVSGWGWALAVEGGKRGLLVSGDVEEGFEEEIPDAFSQGGRLTEGGCPEGLPGACGAGLGHPLVLFHRGCPTAGGFWRAKAAGGLAGAVAGGEACGEGRGVGRGRGMIIAAVCGVG